MHFLAAIMDRGMTVTVRDGAREALAAKDTLGTILERRKEQKRRHGGIMLAGAQAWRAWRTFGDGASELECGPGVRIRFRPLADGETSSRVQVYRDGMWITNEAYRLDTGQFGGCRPFDAVVMLDPAAGDFYGLVRDAEGPEHRGLDFERIEQAERSALRQRLREISDLLMEAAGERDTEEQYIPQGFAVFGGERPAGRKMQPLVPSGPDGGGGVRAGRRKRNKRKKKGRGSSPQPGRRIGVRWALAAEPENGDGYRVLHLAWETTEPGAQDAVAGVRLMAPSGSDETCEQPLGPRWLKMTSISWDGGEARSAAGALELTAPLSAPQLAIALAEPLADAGGLGIDVVRRRKEGQG